MGEYMGGYWCVLSMSTCVTICVYMCDGGHMLSATTCMYIGMCQGVETPLEAASGALAQRAQLCGASTT